MEWSEIRKEDAGDWSMQFVVMQWDKNSPWPCIGVWVCLLAPLSVVLRSLFIDTLGLNIFMSIICSLWHCTDFATGTRGRSWRKEIDWNDCWKTVSYPQLIFLFNCHLKLLIEFNSGSSSEPDLLRNRGDELLVPCTFRYDLRLQVS